MFKTSYLREVRKEKFERSDVFEEPSSPESDLGPAPAPIPAAVPTTGWESLQELNSRFARYINRARVLEQRNAVFRAQLETLRRMEEAPGLEEAFLEQINGNQQRIRELRGDRAKLERELKDGERMLDEYTSRYRNECEYQEQLRISLEQLNKEADTVLLRNLEYQIQLQFLQDDLNATKERHKKNLAEIQTYLSILHQINHSIPLMSSVTVSEVCDLCFCSSYSTSAATEDQERVTAQRRLPALRSQLEEYKSALCQLQAQKQRLQAERSDRLDQIRTAGNDGLLLEARSSLDRGSAGSESVRTVPLLCTSPSNEGVQKMLDRGNADASIDVLQTSSLEQNIKSMQESNEEEIQTHNTQMETLRREIEEAEKQLEKYTTKNRQLASYQSSLENELERYKRIIENEDNRLNSAIIGTPVTLFTSCYKYTHSPSITRRGRGESLEAGVCYITSLRHSD
ncbi:hypothetical protein DNTS_031006 [Danionella cerebrum]|uniref:Filensin n=1 Tax=Danionella cerebrum TaxID=2873325 RepID=A0A553PVC2_9TELE|nr:hypothetical protein DNTS_031006 [Danionella translucida]